MRSKDYKYKNKSKGISGSTKEFQIRKLGLIDLDLDNISLVFSFIGIPRTESCSEIS